MDRRTEKRHRSPKGKRQRVKGVQLKKILTIEHNNQDMSDEPVSETTGCGTEPSLRELAGLITDEEAKAMGAAIQDRNRRQNEKLDRITDLLSE